MWITESRNYLTINEIVVLLAKMLFMFAHNISHLKRIENIITGLEENWIILKTKEGLEMVRKINLNTLILLTKERFFYEHLREEDGSGNITSIFTEYPG
jgi:hypothetical protein